MRTRIAHVIVLGLWNAREYAVTAANGIPIFVIQGAEEFTTPPSLARSLVDSIRAPRKAFVTIDGRHIAVFMQSDAFLEELMARVMPLVERP